jgi:hypothetical protein
VAKLTPTAASKQRCAGQSREKHGNRPIKGAVHDVENRAKTQKPPGDCFADKSRPRA